MTADELFLRALEIDEPAKRIAFVKRSCTNAPKLQRRVLELLQAHDQSGEILKSPVMADLQGEVQKILKAHEKTSEDARVSSEMEKTTLQPFDAEGASAQKTTDNKRDEVELQFRQHLAASSRPGWLGRLGHYEIEELLGYGAFGVVAKAFDTKLHRVVAIKMMRPELAATSPPRKRFLREARTAAAVPHDNIVGIHAVEEKPIPYLVMEFVSGHTLHQQLNQQGPLDPKDVLEISLQLARGLAAAHKANLIHRDIKPANILLTESPTFRAKISDFGLARAVDDASLTSSGVVAGTPLYMAPEQARGETLDNRADLFSLGSVMYQMISGRPPFRASNTVAVLKRVCDDTPRAIADVIPGSPDWLCSIVYKLLEKQPEDRYQTADELADLLKRCKDQLKTGDRVTGAPVLRASTVKRATAARWTLSPRLVAAGVLLITIVATVIWQSWGTASTKGSAQVLEPPTSLPAGRKETVPDSDILAFVKSVGGRVTLGAIPLASTNLVAQPQPAALVSDKLHFDFRNSKFNNGLDFGDNELIELAKLLEARPDIQLGVLSLVGTKITNTGLLSLRRVSLDEIHLFRSDVACDEIAAELATFQIKDWDFGLKLSGKGLAKFVTNPNLEGLSLDSRRVGAKSLQTLTGTRLKRLQVWGAGNRPLPEVNTLRQIRTLETLYLPAYGLTRRRADQIQERLENVVVKTSSYFDRIPPPPEYPETDLEILSLLDSVGGSMHQYRSGGQVKLIPDDAGTISQGRVNISCWDIKGFDDSHLEKLTALLRERPDIFLVCLHLPGTSITNKGLLSLRDIKMSQLFIARTKVNADEVASELSKFEMESTDITLEMSESGLLKVLESKSLRGLPIRPEQLSTSVMKALAGSSVRQLNLEGNDELARSDVEGLEGLTNLGTLNLKFKTAPTDSQLLELHQRVPWAEIQTNGKMRRSPKLSAVVDRLSRGLLLPIDTHLGLIPFANNGF
ncbi:MAG: serine/threonine-protein kinase [Planctomycetaceae bacterium]